MDKYDKLLLDGKFNELIEEVKGLLDIDNENSRLWYLLFLAQNNNYINFDKNNIKNELSYNKALEFASIIEEMNYKVEFDFYSKINVLKGFDKLFRLYQFKEYDKCLSIIKDLCKEKINNVIIEDRIIDYIDFFFNNILEIQEIKIKIVTMNLIYLITDNQKLKKLLFSFINSDIFKNSAINDYELKQNKEDILKFLNDETDHSLYIEGNKKLIANDYNEAIEILTKASNYGDSNAMNKLGFMYHTGKGVKKDLGKAIEYYKKAADLGNVSGIQNLGYMYHFGLGVEKNFDKAKKLYKKAIDLGNSSAMNNFGYMHHFGQGVGKNYSYAFKYYMRSALLGNASGMFNTGFMYEYGLGVTKDIDLAISWYKKSSILGYSLATKRLIELKIKK